MTANIQEIMRQFVKSIKAIQLYSIDHPSAQQAYQPFFEGLTDFLKNHGHIELNIEQYSMSYDNQVVYQEREKDISIAFRLFRDGVRNIKIIEGIEFDEMILFLEVISHATREQDIALDLWECNFSHIDFYVIEEEDEDLNYELPTDDIKNIDLTAKLISIIAKEKLNMNEPIDTALDEKDLASLKAQILSESRESNLSVAISTLVNFLQHDQSAEITDSLIEILSQSIDNNDFYNARLIVFNLNEYAGINAIDRYEKENIILGFKNLVNTIPDEVYNQFLAFIALFSVRSLAFFIQLMPSVKRPERLERLRDNVAYIAQRDYHPMLSFLQGKNADLIVNTIAVLSRLENPEIIGHLEPLRTYPRADIRVSLVKAFEVLKQPAKIAPFLDDEDPSVRIKALQILTEIKYPPIYNKLIVRINSRNFTGLDLTEQKETFNCLIANGGQGLVNILKKLLFRWKLFGAKRYRTIRRLAASGLASINTDESRLILQNGTKKRNKDIRQACEAGLSQ